MSEVMNVINGSKMDDKIKLGAGYIVAYAVAALLFLSGFVCGFICGG